ncbi:hypothetical protein CANCADRAFT_23371 [Tortispora caseinolytica NRRL Y-17796]|uniref:Methyltransferase type 11 domain-containing protein n=1 Tax=Tortispora caseinolytica NRRL Y-17796 TaxID=767744 RepID=A0A1E4TM48_9ASCO|nr:hypothetical protein CANCADRAFT_23371 [Tortispora caseinolytica NRRL Y-17796]
MSKVNQIAQSSFTANHEIYDRVRPSFDKDGVAFLIEEVMHLKPGAKVIEVGAGTGLFTETLKPYDLNILAVEPSEGMRESFKKRCPDVEIVDGDAYSLPVEDGIADAVLVAQAFHWFADSDAVKEFRRVLKKGGYLGLLWNNEDMEEASEVQRKCVELMWSYDSIVPQQRHNKWQKPLNESSQYFQTPFQEKKFKTSRLINKETVWPMMLSRSYITSLSDDEKQKLKQKVDEILVGAPEVIDVKLYLLVAWMQAI